MEVSVGKTRTRNGLRYRAQRAWERGKILWGILVIAAALFAAWLGMVLWFIGKVLFYYVPKPLIGGSIYCVSVGVAWLFVCLLKPRVWEWVPPILVISILGTSTWWSMTADDWTHFQRSGSLLVILAVVSFGSDYQRRLRDAIDDILASMTSTLDGLAGVITKDKEAVPEEFWLYRQMATTKGQWEEIDIDSQARSARRWELALIVCGTLIWAYGDLIVGLF